MSNPNSNHHIEPTPTALFDILILWGKEKLLGNSDDISDLQMAWEEHSDKTTSEALLVAACAELCHNVETSAKDLLSNMIVGLHSNFASRQSQTNSEGSSLYESAQQVIFSAFSNFDKFTFLTESIAYFPFGDSFEKKQLEEKLLLLQDKLLDHDEICPLCWRLIPVNDIRKIRFNAIPEERQYLFPWYEHYSDYHPEALTMLVNYRAELGLDDRISQTALNRLQADVATDSSLNALIQRESMLIADMDEAITGSYTLTWRYAAEAEAANHYMPDKIWDIGPLNASIFAVARDIFLQVPRHKWLFRATACGIGLSRETRTKYFYELETSLKEGRIDANDYPQLIKWQNNAIATDTFFKDLFTGWQKDLRFACKKMANKDFVYSALDFDQLLAGNRQVIVQQVQDILGRSIVDVIVENIKEFVEKAKATSEWVVNTAPVFAGGSSPDSSTDKPQSKTIDMERFHKLEKPESGDLKILPPNSGVAIVNLLRQLKPHWLAIYQNDQQEIVILGPDKYGLTGVSETIPVKGSVGAILLFFAGTKKTLEEIKDKVQSNQSESLSTILEDKTKKIIVIEYVDPE